MDWDNELDPEEAKAEVYAAAGCFLTLCAGVVLAVAGAAALGWWIWVNADKAWSILR